MLEKFGSHTVIALESQCIEQTQNLRSYCSWIVQYMHFYNLSAQEIIYVNLVPMYVSTI